MEAVKEIPERIVMNSEVVIDINELKKDYQRGAEKTEVLKGITVEILDKDFTVIMGSSGSGKSTFLYCISGMDGITEGNVSFLKQDIGSMKEDKLSLLRRKNMGFVFQQMNLMPNLNLFENIVLPGFLLNVRPGEEIKERARMLMQQFHIEDLEERMPTQISGGQMQRAAIARALINEPEIIFADEPTGALNSTSGKEVLDVLTMCNTNGQSILMVTHDIKAAQRANRIIYLSDGYIKGEKNLKPYTQEKNIKDREDEVLTWLLEMGW